MKNWIRNLFKTYKIAEYKTTNSTQYVIMKKRWILGEWIIIKSFVNKEAANYYLKNQI